MKLIIAGGGTGGHLFPAVSVAEVLMEEDSKNEVVFVGTEKGIENRVIPALGYKLKVIKSSGIKGKGLAGKIKSMIKMPVGIFQSIKIIRKYKPDCLLGVGGYASAPAVFAGILTGIPTAIHEQNTIPGFTNKVMARWVDKIFVSFEITKKYFSGRKVVLTGNPVRASFLKNIEQKVERSSKFTVLVFGGSRGAHTINKGIIEATKYLFPIAGDLKIIHQTGESDFEETLASYSEKGFDFECYRFIENMVEAYKKSDLVICRAGASSLAEIAILGIPSILVPYPFAIYNHQEFNAREIAGCVGAEIIPDNQFNGKVIADKILYFYKNRNLLSEMGKNVQKLAKPLAAKQIINELEGLIHV